MQAPHPSTPAAAPGCPLYAGTLPAQAHPAGLQPADELVLPMHQRVVAQYLDNQAGQRELHLFYGDKQITFDEPGWFGFGEALARQPRFVAGMAVHWSPGRAWPEVRALLEQLLDEGVLRRAAEVESEEAALGGARDNPLPPAPCPVHRPWREACEALTAELAGRPLERGWLELVVPIFRVAHTALDAEGRQVGEANVFPPALRTEVPTSWRTCIYPGTRYQVDRPMNVTALKAMRQHWPQMMAALGPVREAYLRRFPEALAGWTVGHLERLATAVLAVPSLQLMREDRPLPGGLLHPALSCLFRVTDGLRMTMHQMLFVPIGEPTLSPDAAMSAAEVMAYAERNYSFHSEHGVCAGPQTMIEEFLGVLVDGRAPRSAAAPVPFDPPVREALGDVESALDYALLGLQAYAAVFSMWPLMTRSYERLATVAEAWSQNGGPAVQGLRDHLRGLLDALHASTFLATEAWRADREKVYADMYAQCGRGLGRPASNASLPGLLAPVRTGHHLQAERRLAEALEQRYGRADRWDNADLCRMVDAIMDFLLQAQAVLRTATEVQQRINRHLHRPAPQRAFSAADLDIHNLMQGSATRRLPYLPDELERLLGVKITLDSAQFEISATPRAVAACAAAAPESAGMVPAEARA